MDRRDRDPGKRFFRICVRTGGGNVRTRDREPEYPDPEAGHAVFCGMELFKDAVRHRRALCAARDHMENLESNIHNNLYQINLEVTEKCNLRCKYCIYNDDCTSNRNFGYRDMPLEIAKAGIDYAVENAGDDIAVTFYGGEPLIKFDLIKWCVDYAKKKLGDKNLSFNLTTNLTLVTKEMAEYLASIEKFSVLCSLDGDEESHNAYRVFKDGKGSFSAAIEGLKMLVEAMGDAAENRLSINAVFAPPYTIEHVHRIYDFFDKLDWFPRNMKVTLTYPSEGSVDDKEEIKELMYEKDGDYFVFNPLISKH